MKILFVSHTPLAGGAEEGLIRLLEGLSAEHSVAVACPAPGPLAGRIDAAGVQRYSVPAFEASLRPHPVQTPVGLAHLGAAGVALARLVRRVRPDIVHANSPRAGLMSALACSLGGPAAGGARARRPSRRAGWAGACDSCSPARRTASSPCHASPRGALTKGSSGRSQPSSTTASTMSASTPSASARLRCARNSASRRTSRCSRRCRRSHHGRVRPQRFARSPGCARGDSTRTCWWWGRWPSRAVRCVTTTAPTSTRSIACGPSWALRTPSTSWAGARTSPRCWERLDLSVLPSRNEPFGRAIVESMAMGTPALVSESGSGPELIEDGVSGRLLNPDAPGDWADAAAALIADRATADPHGGRGARVRRAFQRRGAGPRGPQGVRKRVTVSRMSIEASWRG